MDFKKELLLYAILFVFFSIGMHFSAWTTAPVAHLEHLPQSSLGVCHPLYLSLIAYLLVLVLRGVVLLLKRFFVRG